MFEPLKETTDSVSRQTAGNVENEIVHIRCPHGKGKLNDLNDQRDGSPGQHYFFEGIYGFVDQGEQDACGNEHGKIADDI